MPDAPLTRSRTVLTHAEDQDLVDDGPVIRSYTHTLDEKAEWPERTRVLVVDDETFVDLGAPAQITVTIEPGDQLNDADREENHGAATLSTIARGDGTFDWRLTHENGDQLCGSAQGYSTRTMAWEMGRRCIAGTYSIAFEEPGAGHG